MTEAKSIYATVTVNSKKVEEILQSYIPEIEAGSITEDQIRIEVMKRSSEFMEICSSFGETEEIDPIDERVQYTVYKNGEEKEGTYQEVYDWLHGG